MKEPHSAPIGACEHQARDFDSHKVGALWEVVVDSASCVPCPGKIWIFPNREILRWEGQHFQPLSASARAGEVAGWADTAQGWIGHSGGCLTCCGFFIFIPSVLRLRCNQDESVSHSNKEVGPAAFYWNFHCSNLMLTALNFFDHRALWKECSSLLFSTSNVSVLTPFLFPLLALSTPL